MSASFKVTGAAAAAAMLIGGTASADLVDMSMQFYNVLDWNPANQGSAVDNENGTSTFTLGSPEAPVAISNPSNPSTSFDVFYSCTSGYIGNSGGSPGGNSAFIDAAFEVTNTGNTTETFTLLMTLGSTGAIGPNAIMNGSVAATVTNNSFTGDAMMNALTGDSVYKAFTDVVDPNSDTPALTLMDDPFSLFTDEAFGSDAGDANQAPTAGPDVTDSISIMFEFELTAGDSASVSGLFNIAAVPAPGAMALLGLAGLAGTRRRRR